MLNPPGLSGEPLFQLRTFQYSYLKFLERVCVYMYSPLLTCIRIKMCFSVMSVLLSVKGKSSPHRKQRFGKSTLMRLITKELLPSEGQIICPDIPYSIPQHFGQFNHLTVAGALGIERSICTSCHFTGRCFDRAFYGFGG